MAPIELPEESESKDRESGIIKFISKAFDSQEITYDSDVAVGSTSSDFFVKASSGSTAVFEVKIWQPTTENLVRASHLASLRQGTSGADYAYVVLPGDFRSDPSTGVVSLSQIGADVETHLVKPPKKKRKRLPKVTPRPKKFIFAAMPFAATYDDTFEVAMKPAAIELGFDCIRVDHTRFTGDVVAEIKRLIPKSACVVADLSDSRPNVLFELGYAIALGKPFVQVCTDRDKLPFDVRNNRTLKYSIGQTSHLKNRLKLEFQGLVL